MDQLDPHVPAECLHHLIALTFAHQSRVDVHARELRTDRTMHQRRRNGRVHTAGETADHAVIAHLGPHGSDLIVDHR